MSDKLVLSPREREALARNIAAAIAEDIATGDINAELIPAEQIGQARIIARESAVLSGRAWAEAAFLHFAPDAKMTWHAQDGARLHANSVLVEIQAPARALLSAERTALNFLQTLSGTATTTAEYVARIAHTKTRLLDTRKTLPGLRDAQKYAVRCGGGWNHRIGLFDAFLLKENHIAAAGSITQAVHKARALYPDRFLQVEVETRAQLEECLALGVPRVLLDNFTPAQTAELVQWINGRMELEASGGIDASTLVAYAEAGVDFISIGSLTKHMRAVDLSMRFV
jgi:nicotinate-nucleotide pyrophosphorylase (carboxylating)